MAVRPSVLYPGQVITTDPNFPHGRARNVAVAGDGTGSPLEEAWLSDLWGFQQALLAAAGITPSDVPDQVGTSQYLEAIQAIIGNPIETQIVETVAKTWISKATVTNRGAVIVWDPFTNKWFSFGSDGSSNPVVSTLLGCGVDWIAGASIPAGSTLTNISGQRAASDGAGSIVYGGDAGGANNVFRQSADGGATWTAHNTAVTGNPEINGMCWHESAGLFVAIHGSTADNIETSPDGITFTQRSTPNSTSRGRIKSNGSLMVVVSIGTTDKVLTSSDGLTWTERTLPSSASWQDVAWSETEGKWLIIASNDAIATSSDGLTWTSAGTATGTGVGKITNMVCIDSIFVGVAEYDSADRFVKMSKDLGATWENVLQLSADIAELGVGDKQFVVATDTDVHYWTMRAA